MAHNRHPFLVRRQQRYAGGGVLEQLGKEVEAGGSASQPDSAADMCRFVVDYCIGTYERLPKTEESNHHGQESIRQSFPTKSTSLFVIPSRCSSRQLMSRQGIDETNLFDGFSKKTGRWLASELKKETESTPSLEDEASPKGSFKASLNAPPKALLEASPRETPEGSAKDLTYGDITDNIKTAEELCCEIKDIRDELNIIQSVAQHQKTVGEGLTAGSPDVDLAAAYIVKDIKEMDNSAERIQLAVGLPVLLMNIVV